METTKIHMAEGDDNYFSPMVAGTQYLFIDDADHHLKRVDSSGVIKDIDSPWNLVIDDALSATTNLNTALSGTWAINSGVLRQSAGGGPNRITYATVAQPTGMRKVEVEVSYISGSGTRRIGLFPRTTNTSNGNNPVLYLESSNGTTWDARVEHDGSSLIYSGNSGIYSGTGYVKLQAIAVGNQIDYYVGGTYITSINHVTNQNIDFKHVGFYVHNATADYRNLKVWTVGSPVTW